MHLLRTLVEVPIACAVLGGGIYSFSAPAKTQELIGRSVSLGGRQLQCNNAPIMVDRTCRARVQQTTNPESSTPTC